MMSSEVEYFVRPTNEWDVPEYGAIAGVITFSTLGAVLLTRKEDKVEAMTYSDDDSIAGTPVTPKYFTHVIHYDIKCVRKTS